MADPARRLETNVSGDFYVDASCIDCATCRWMAPAVFDRAGEASRVHAQPKDPAMERRALEALLACPTASIGTLERHDLKPVVRGFPRPLPEDDADPPRVLHCGFHDESSFGAAAWFVRRDAGNVLVDVPRFTAPLVARLEELGGVRWLFLTHRDDVASHERFRERFGCDRVLHRRDVTDGTRDVEVVLEGDRETRLDADLLAIPTPGHTRGSACLLLRDTHLFSGDHLARRPGTDRLYAFRSACWFDWETQIRSMERLAAHDFEWVLPGHGHYAPLPRGTSRARVAECVAWMKSVA